mmetsp:Transcript_11377/g.33741  ORF Transcript_11377/g.33741 Transcript_11377/m.33741 type:complete len:214 (+) Transcript_11377:1490-2131(+)
MPQSHQLSTQSGSRRKSASVRVRHGRIGRRHGRIGRRDADIGGPTSCGGPCARPLRRGGRDGDELRRRLPATQLRGRRGGEGAAGRRQPDERRAEGLGPRHERRERLYRTSRWIGGDERPRRPARAGRQGRGHARGRTEAKGARARSRRGERPGRGPVRGAEAHSVFTRGRARELRSVAAGRFCGGVGVSPQPVELGDLGHRLERPPPRLGIR